jgi:hypothetical protein
MKGDQGDVLDPKLLEEIITHFSFESSWLFDRVSQLFYFTLKKKVNSAKIKQRTKNV